jgi:hypothetical protein
MLAQRVCRRDPLLRRLDGIYGRGPQLAWGQESASLERRVADSGKESVCPKGGGVLSAAPAHDELPPSGVMLYSTLSGMLMA